MFRGLAEECYKLVGEKDPHISHPWWRSNDPLNPPTSFHKSSIFCKKRLYTNVMKVNNQLFLILSVCLESLETRKVSLNNGTTSIVDRDAGHTDKLFIHLKSFNNSIALLLFCPTQLLNQSYHSFEEVATVKLSF